MASEALRFHADGMREDGESIPPPSSVDAIMADPQHRDAIAILVDLPERSRRVARINVSLPEDIIQSIDRVAGRRRAGSSQAAAEIGVNWLICASRGGKSRAGKIRAARYQGPALRHGFTQAAATTSLAKSIQLLVNNS